MFGIIATLLILLLGVGGYLVISSGGLRSPALQHALAWIASAPQRPALTATSLLSVGAAIVALWSARRRRYGTASAGTETAATGALAASHAGND